MAQINKKSTTFAIRMAQCGFWSKFLLSVYFWSKRSKSLIWAIPQGKLSGAPVFKWGNDTNSVCRTWIDFICLSQAFCNRIYVVSISDLYPKINFQNNEFALPGDLVQVVSAVLYKSNLSPPAINQFARLLSTENESSKWKKRWAPKREDPKEHLVNYTKHTMI